jgi:hypothetical protein
VSRILDRSQKGMRAQVRAGVRGKVAAAMERAETLEGQLDAQAAAHAQAIEAAAAQAAALQRQLQDADAAAGAAAAQLRTAQADADRCPSPQACVMPAWILSLIFCDCSMQSLC